jgi:hypothetical protein
MIDALEQKQDGYCVFHVKHSSPPDEPDAAL